MCSSPIPAARCCRASIGPSRVATLNKKKSKPARESANNSKRSSESPMDVTLLDRIVKLMSANDLNTVDVRDGDKRVILKRGAVQQTGYMMAHAPAAPAPSSAPPTHAMA